MSRKPAYCNQRRLKTTIAFGALLCLFSFLGLKTYDGTGQSNGFSNFYESQSVQPSEEDAPFFKCPDGRRGLHVVHVRLLLGLTLAKGVNGTYLATRELFFRDFTLPSLARQTSQGFVLYVSTDINQDSSHIQSIKDMLSDHVIHGAKWLFLPERGWLSRTDSMLAHSRMVDVLSAHGLALRRDLENVDIYLTTRIDADDAGHVTILEQSQAEACSFISSAKHNKILIMYPNPKLFWLPSSQSPYGLLADINSNTTEKEMELQKFGLSVKPLLQSMAVDKSLLQCGIKINCYSHRHYRPWEIELQNNLSCPFTYSNEYNWIDVAPAYGNTAALYARSVGTSYFHRDSDSGYNFLPFDIDITKSMGIKPSELSTLNLLMSHLAEDAPQAVAYPAAGWKRG